MRKIPFIQCLLCFIALTLLNCSTDKNPSFSYSQSDVDLINGTVLINKDSLYQPLLIEYIQGKLFVYDMMDEVPISIYDPNSGQKLDSFGGRGRGPGEMRDISNISFHNDSLYLFDPMNFTLLKYPISDVSSLPTQFKIEPKGLTLQYQKLSDTKFIASGFLGDIMLGVYDQQGAFINGFGVLKGDTLEPVTVRQHLYRKKVVTNPVENKIAIAYHYTDLIEIYDYDERLIRSVFGPIQEPPIYDIENERFTKNDDTRINYISLKSDGKYIYALYSNRLMSEPANNSADLLHVFDWEGNVIRIVRFNERLFDITIDPERQILYGITFEPEIGIYQYQL